MIYYLYLDKYLSQSEKLSEIKLPFVKISIIGWKICTLRSINDVTEGITKEPPMGDP